MKIVLNQEDIENMIKDQYDGVDEIEFDPKEFIASLKVLDMTKFLKRKQVETAPKAVKDTRTPEERFVAEQTSKVMASGGKNRALPRIG